MKCQSLQWVGTIWWWCVCLSSALTCTFRSFFESPSKNFLMLVRFLHNPEQQLVLPLGKSPLPGVSMSLWGATVFWNHLQSCGGSRVWNAMLGSKWTLKARLEWMEWIFNLWAIFLKMENRIYEEKNIYKSIRIYVRIEIYIYIYIWMMFVCLWHWDFHDFY